MLDLSTEDHRVFLHTDCINLGLTTSPRWKHPKWKTLGFILILENEGLKVDLI